jgi:hypothetical protein
MGIDEANDHLASMDDSTKTLSDSVKGDEKYLDLISEQMQLMQQNTEHLDSELESDQEYFKLVANCMQSLSDSLLALQKMGDGMFHEVMTELLKPPSPLPAKTDVESLLPPVESP